MLKQILTAAFLLIFLSPAIFAQSAGYEFDQKELLERVKKLSSDAFEGRGPGTPGGQLAARYIADQLREAGVRPGNGASFFQQVRLAAVKADPTTGLNIEGRGNPLALRFGDDFVATTGSQAAAVDLDAEIVFAGYGIDAPLYNWNDYSGSPADYRGKILMILVNDPPATADEPNLFGGKALTYFGRWTYKFEEAARRGAAGVILVHTNDSAGYGWNVVRSSNSGWRYEIARSKADRTPYLDLKSWVTKDGAEKILKAAGLELSDLQKAAARRGFRPVNTGLRAKIALRSELKFLNSPNIVGVVDGSAGRPREYVLYTSHWDHIGTGVADSRGDKIYNGAYDNASGVATVLSIAEVLARTPKKERPKRSFIFLFPTAEEQGLLGAEYYTRFPIFPLERTIANVNLDGVNFFGKTTYYSALGAERSTITDAVAAAMAERGYTLEADQKPEQGFFYRSDHFPFARAGVPAISLRAGEKFSSPLSGDAESFFKDYTAKYYHQTTDEFQPWWSIEAMTQEAELALDIGKRLANSANAPQYNRDDEFYAAGQRRVARRK